METTMETTMEIQNMDGKEFLKGIDDGVVDLVLTDPPYIISRESGMNSLINRINNNQSSRTEEDFNKYYEEKLKEKELPEKTLSKMRKNYLKYGDVLGKKYAYKTDYGDWDSNFTMEEIEFFMKEYYRILKPSGTCIVFFDLFKISYLKEIFESVGFKQIRMIEWIKTNPQPLNSKVNYLSNCREIALVGVKGSKPKFHSSYDNGIYLYPIYTSKDRFHPTQKNVELFEDIIKKHSDENDIVLDSFLGSGTTAIACRNSKRKFIGCEKNKKYYDLLLERIGKIVTPNV